MLKIKRIMILVVLLITVLLACGMAYYRLNEYKVSLQVKLNAQAVIGWSFESYDRETVQLWLDGLKKAEPVVEHKAFHPADAVAGLKVYQETGVVYYLSNVYWKGDYIYLSHFLPDKGYVRMTVRQFNAFSRKKEQPFDFVKFGLRLPLKDIDFAGE